MWTRLLLLVHTSITNLSGEVKALQQHLPKYFGLSGFSSMPHFEEHGPEEDSSLEPIAIVGMCMCGRLLIEVLNANR